MKETKKRRCISSLITFHDVFTRQNGDIVLFELSHLFYKIINDSVSSFIYIYIYIYPTRLIEKPVIIKYLTNCMNDESI